MMQNDTEKEAADKKAKDEQEAMEAESKKKVAAEAESKKKVEEATGVVA